MQCKPVERGIFRPENQRGFNPGTGGNCNHGDFTENAATGIFPADDFVC